MRRSYVDLIARTMCIIFIYMLMSVIHGNLSLQKYSVLKMEIFCVIINIH